MSATKIEPGIAPVQVTVTDAAVWPGKIKNGHQLPAQLSLKGRVGGVPDLVALYLPADLAVRFQFPGAKTRVIKTKDGTQGTAYDLPADRTVWLVQKSADGVVDLYEPGTPRAPVPPPNFTEPPKALQTAPEVMPWDGKPAVHLEREAGEMTPLENLFALYDDCFAHAIALARENPDLPLESVSAMASTLFIAASKIR